MSCPRTQGSDAGEAPQSRIKPSTTEPLRSFFRPVKFSIKLHKIKSWWSIVYIEGSRVIISKEKNVFFSLKMDFVLANSAVHDEMLHYAAFHLGIHCLP